MKNKRFVVTYENEAHICKDLLTGEKWEFSKEWRAQRFADAKMKENTGANMVNLLHNTRGEVVNVELA
jgi:hypothetical protein